jgi:hypothetical protein
MNMDEMNTEDQGGTSIELMIKADGTMTVSMEAGDVEGQESNETPARDLNDALRIISQLAGEVIAQAGGADAENTAYDSEMAAQ